MTEVEGDFCCLTISRFRTKRELNHQLDPDTTFGASGFIVASEFRHRCLPILYMST